jgi:hypothetical protein
MAEILANCKWNSTPFCLIQGQKYRFASQGTWKDASHECTATGYTDARLRWWEGWRRYPEGQWFSLIGRIDGDSTLFDIGRIIEQNEVFTAPATGTLSCFANDVYFMYWNNSGSVELDVRDA